MSNNPFNWFDPTGESAAIAFAGVALAGVTAIVIYHYINNPPYPRHPIPDYPGEKQKYKRHRQSPKVKPVFEPAPSPEPPPKNCFEGCRDEHPCSFFGRWLCYLGCFIGGGGADGFMN